MLKEPLRSILINYYQVEAYDLEFIRAGINSGGGFSRDYDLFVVQLREAIDKNLIFLAEYERYTGQDFDSQEDLTAWLENIYSDLIEIKVSCE